jgi:chemotaxis signal transduction protein
MAEQAVDAGVLEERARALARPLRVEAEGATVELVVLALGRRRYGLDTAHVVAVETLLGLTRVPGLPPVWAGLMNLRGTLRPVLNLRRYLSLPEPAEPPYAGPRSSELQPLELRRTEMQGPRKVALVTGGGLVVGLLVDEAVAIVRVPLSQVGAALTGSPAAAGGVTPDLLTVLDVQAVLADSRLAVREESL